MTKSNQSICSSNRQKNLQNNNCQREEIIATENHNFLTTDGWKAVEDMTEDTKIGIYTEPKNCPKKLKTLYVY